MLTDRKLRILEAIINDFIESAQPVGSRTISKKYLLGISPATIRNEMADLEELGYLFQPHTSSGRIPSDLGYRFFVDRMIDFAVPNLSLYTRLHSLFLDPDDNPVEKAAEMLGAQTGSVAVICLPSFGKAKLENLKLVKVYHSKVLMIIVAGEGKIRYSELRSDLSQKDLDIASEVLLKQYRGKSVEEIDLRAVQKNQQEGYEYFIPSVREALKSIKTSEVVTGSAKGLLENQDITSTEQLRSLFSILDDKDSLEELFAQIIKEKEHTLGVKIGSEFDRQSLQDYAVICTEFGFRDYDKGFIGIIGPKRMNYETNGALVAAYAKALTELFSGIYL